jgi:hypothetical protein
MNRLPLLCLSREGVCGGLPSRDFKVGGKALKPTASSNHSEEKTLGNMRAGNSEEFEPPHTELPSLLTAP